MDCSLSGNGKRYSCFCVKPEGSVPVSVSVHVPRLVDNGTVIVMIAVFPAADGLGVKLKDIHEE